MDNFDKGLAILSAAAYRVGRTKQNLVPFLPGAIPVEHEDLAYKNDPATGFEASGHGIHASRGLACEQWIGG
jgi:hypothetical protein